MNVKDIILQSAQFKPKRHCFAVAILPSNRLIRYEIMELNRMRMILSSALSELNRYILSTRRVTAINLRQKAPSPAGEGRGEENKNKAKALFDPLILTFSLREKELTILN
jgi:hypothetical protein